MVQGKKGNDSSNGTTKYQTPNMSFPRKDMAGPKGDTRQNGNASSFRTDSAISGNRNQGERTLQRWVPDAPADVDGSLESTRSKSNQPWDQFAENEKRFGLKTDYDENIYTTAIDKAHPQYKQRLADADRKAREIERSTATNSHIAEERVRDNLAAEENGLDEEDKYSGVRRQQDFPPLTSSNNKYTPPARRAPTGQSTVTGAPVDPAIISSQLARSDKPAVEKPAVEKSVVEKPAVEKPKPAPASKPVKPEVSTPPTTTESSFAATPEPKANAAASTSASRTASPQVKPDGAPNATATVERDVTHAFKNFASRERTNVEKARISRARNDKEIKLNDLKKFADSFKLNTPVPSDLVSIIAKDPAKQKEIQEKAKRNAEAAAANPSEGVKPVPPPADTRSTQRSVPAAQGAALNNRQVPNRNSGYPNPAQFRGPTQSSQSSSAQQTRAPGTLGSRLRNVEQNKQSQIPGASHDSRPPPTGPANNGEANFSRRSSGVTSAQGARLNPHIAEFRPNAHAPTFNPNGNPSSGSSPRSAVNTLPPTPISRSLLRRKPLSEAERPSIAEKFNALEYIKTLKPPKDKDWKYTGGMKPAYDTHPLWRQPADDEPPTSNMQLTYVELFERAPFPPQPIASPNTAHALPQVPHQHQLPFHLQQGVHNIGVRQSPRQAPMNIHGNQHMHGPTPPFNGHDDHRMMPSHSAQSFQSPRLQNTPMYGSPMGQPAQMYNPQMMAAYPGAPQMQGGYRSMSQNHQFMPQQGGPMGPIMMQNPNPTFLTSQGMPPGPQMIYAQGGPAPFMPPGNGHPPQMPINGFPASPRGAPMMMSQGSQQGHQQAMYNMGPGMSPAPHFAPMYAQGPPSQMQGRGYAGPNQFGTSPQQQMHHLGHQHRNNQQNGNYTTKTFQPHQNGPGSQVPTGPQGRNSEGNEETK